jgi:putative acetyltransferase
MPHIRHEQPEDIAAVRHVHERAFGRPDEARLVDALRAAGKVALSLVAEEDGRVVGHILFSPVTLTSGEHALAGVGLGPMAVLPERQRRRIGALLVQAGLTACRKAGHAYVVVLGHPEYYSRFGFVPASRYNIRSAYEAPDEAFMIVAIQQAVLCDRGGLIRYPPEFDSV